MSGYNQPEKQQARLRLLSCAVNRLTSKRAETAVLRPGEIRCTSLYALDWLKKHGIPTPWEKEFKELLAEFTSKLASSVGIRAPDELKVLYLCGPEPTNDLNVLLSLGCSVDNIWAVESSHKVHSTALKSLSDSGLYLKTHWGNLESFFQNYNDSFDLVYYDATGPLLGRHPNTILPLLTLFERERLNPVGALVTTFAEVPSETKTAYSELMAAYFSGCCDEIPRPLLDAGVDPARANLDWKYLVPYVSQNIDATYDDFVTRFVVDLGRHILPYSRIGAVREILDRFLNDKAVVSEIVRQVSDPPNASEFSSFRDYFAKLVESSYFEIIAPSFPLFVFLQRALKSEGSRLIEPLRQYSVSGTPIFKAYPPLALLEALLDVSPQMAGEELRKMLGVWFDLRGRYFCDAPQPRLAISLATSVYGHPYFVNPAASIRLKYRAKVNTMLSDCLLLDRADALCRLVPSVELLARKLSSIPFQLLVRVCIDRIQFHDFSSSSRPFKGAAIGGLGEHSFAQPIDFASRELIPPSSDAGEE